ncbi:hypothetical protein GWI33_017571 [Rhynchophorus ferrugineus]|uniref:Uncharacterized protein n=1 Tax=Rhynchophorus ferrugineus TaxID=354439 RepID=A0A834HV79_RHYFE|nr:hypothetical protein GWI33_017571 [Rhynchophorus ferrugineus]
MTMILLKSHQKIPEMPLIQNLAPQKVFIKQELLDRDLEGHVHAKNRHFPADLDRRDKDDASEADTNETNDSPLDLRVNFDRGHSPVRDRDSGTESDDTEDKLMIQDDADCKPYKKSLIKRFDKEQNNYLHQLLSRQRSDLQHQSLCEYARRKTGYPTSTGSLPPSPADSGVSDVDSSSSGHASTDELKARLQPSIHSPVGGLFPRHPSLNWNTSIHQHSQRQNHVAQQFYQPFTSHLAKFGVADGIDYRIVVCRHREWIKAEGERGPGGAGATVGGERETGDFFERFYRNRKSAGPAAGLFLKALGSSHYIIALTLT